MLEELAAIAFANGTDFATITHNGLVRLTPTDEVPEEKKRPLPPSRRANMARKSSSTTR